MFIATHLQGHIGQAMHYIACMLDLAEGTPPAVTLANMAVSTQRFAHGRMKVVIGIRH